MKLSLASALLLAPLTVTATETVTVKAPGPKQWPSETPKLGKPTSQGCFKAVVAFPDHVGSLDLMRLSVGACNVACRDMKKAVAAMDTTGCHCGDEYPPEGDKTADSDCNWGCQAYPLEACGSESTYSVWNTGIKLQVAHMKGDGDSSSSSSSSTGEASTRTRTVTRSITSGLSQATTDASSTVTETQTETETKLATATVSEGTGSTSTSAAAATTSSGESAGSRTLVGAGVAVLAAIAAF